MAIVDEKATVQCRLICHAPGSHEVQPMTGIRPTPLLSAWTAARNGAARAAHVNSPFMLASGAYTLNSRLHATQLATGSDNHMFSPPRCVDLTHWSFAPACMAVMVLLLLSAVTATAWLATAHGGVTITADTPVLVHKTSYKGEYVFFPQTLHWVRRKLCLLLISADVQSATCRHA